jgi:DNA (cytosine-5)-methyltransferase 1
MNLTHFSLFSGIGGIDLSAEWAGFETVGQCEFADYPTKVLEKHWPDVPRWRDVRDVTAESVRARGIGDITLISGGFPCQPFSSLGNKLAKEDERYLWPEMLRIITELRPYWVVGENVTAIDRGTIDDVLADLENNNYKARPFEIPACVFGAPDERYRVFIVAHDNGIASLQTDKKTFSKSFKWNPWLGLAGQVRIFASGANWEKGKPAPYGVDDGLPSDVDEIKCHGNAVKPQQVYPILKAIADIERGTINAHNL